MSRSPIEPQGPPLHLHQAVRRLLLRLVLGGMLAAGCLVSGARAQAAPVPDMTINKYFVTPTRLELLTLPQFCWGYFTNLRDPAYYISRGSCGVGMNHYCPGLVKLMRAQNPVNSRKERVRLYSKALKDFNYTLKWMEPYPACYIRAHAQASHARAFAGLQVLGAPASDR